MENEAMYQDAVKTINNGLKLPSLHSGWICNEDVKTLCNLTGRHFTTIDTKVQTIWSIQEPSSESKLFISKSYTLGTLFSDDAGPITGPISPVSKPGLTRVCHDDEGNKRAHLFTSEDESTSYIDIWSDAGLVKRFDLTCKKVHGKAYTNSEFSSLCWNPSCDKLMYLAEKKVPDNCSFYAQNIAENTTPGNVFNFSESWGEQLSKCCKSEICILDIDTGDIKILEIPETIFCSKPTWSTDNVIYFIGMDTHPFKLGAIYCSNRASKLYSYDLTTNAGVSITKENDVVLLPCAEPDRKGRVVFLSCAAGGPHRNYTSISVFWPRTHFPQSPTGDAEKVPGGYLTTVPDSVFCGSLSPAPWIDENNILISSVSGWKCDLYKVNIMSGHKEPLIQMDDQINPNYMSFGIVDQIKSHVLFSYSDFNNHYSDGYQQSLGYIKVNVEKPDHIKYFTCPKNNIDEKFVYKPMEFVREDRTFNGILIRPWDGEKDFKTLIVFPHGGPHSVYTTTFRPDVYIFCKLGYSVLLVNYTGSLGLGPGSMGNLSGNIGDIDVKDVHHAALEVSQEGFDHVAVMGGSHGGFLTAHLVGQYPDFYKAASLRNPVIDISTMVGSTDIPDWSYYEAGLDYDAKRPPIPTPKHITTMLEKSPIQYVDKVKAPVLLLIGSKDLRVPPSQGIRFYQYLKSRNVTCDMKVYPDDCHPLSTVACAADSVMHTHLWFKKHLDL